MRRNYFHTVLLPFQSYVQETVYTCGAAVFRDILKARGVILSEKQAADIVQTDPEAGTSPKALLKAFDLYGVQYQTCDRASIQQIEDSIRSGSVVLIPYQAWPAPRIKDKKLDGGHWSILFGFNRTHFFLADPAKHKMKIQRRLGFRTIEKKRFQKVWADKAYDGTKYIRWMAAVALFASVPKSFAERVYDVVRGIPRGKVLTYKEVAMRAGSPRASRAVGNILNKNYNPDIPCHRVVRSDGAVGGYNRGTRMKMKKLKQEGAVI